MKHIYFLAAILLIHSFMFRMIVAMPDLRLNLSLADAIGYTSLQWMFIAAPLFMLFYDPQRKGVRA